MPVHGSLYRARFDLSFPTFLDKEIVGKDYLLRFQCEETQMIYPVFFSVDNEIGKKVIESLVPGVRASIDGMVKVDKRGMIILRAKKIILENCLDQ